jgi:hypothetical protein
MKQHDSGYFNPPTVNAANNDPLLNALNNRNLRGNGPTNIIGNSNNANHINNNSNNNMNMMVNKFQMVHSNGNMPQHMSIPNGASSNSPTHNLSYNFKQKDTNTNFYNNNQINMQNISGAPNTQTTPNSVKNKYLIFIFNI